MENNNPSCPKCNSEYPYQDGSLWVCPECYHEWSASSVEAADTPKFADVNGVELKDGDSVIVAKDLKLGKTTLKSGTKVKKIKLLDEPVNDHDISCKVDGHGSIYLKCSVVKKA